VRALREEPYSIKEAEAGRGLTTDNGKRASTKMEVDDGAAATAAT
jgi:bud site selection protein 20